MSDPHLRAFAAKDAPQCCKVINTSAAGMEGLNAEALRFILSKNIPEIVSQELSAIYTLVYEEQGVILGLGGLDGNEIKRVYVSPSVQGRGIGSVIVRALEREARSRNIAVLKIQSSPNAVPFYRKLGYRAENEARAKIGNAEFHFTNMEYSSSGVNSSTRYSAG